MSYTRRYKAFEHSFKEVDKISTSFYGSEYVFYYLFSEEYLEEYSFDFFDDYYYESHYYQDWLDCPVRLRNELINEVLDLIPGKVRFQDILLVDHIPSF